MPAAMSLQCGAIVLSPARKTTIVQRPRRKFSCFSAPLTAISTPFCQILRNKVLISVALTAVIAKFSKPFTSVVLHGRNFDFGEAFRPGGFPSTHSSAVVATAITIGIERGFSDSILGLTLVFASLIMHDAQGVRRQVGDHAKVINKTSLGHLSAVLGDVPLKETVGHTKVEVMAGAVLGFVVSVAVSLAKFL